MAHTSTRGNHESAHPRRKYGRVEDNYDRPKLDLTRLLVRSAGDLLEEAGRLPATQDNLTPIKSRLKMLGNDEAGDCESVRWANHRLLMGAGYPTIDQVWELYKTQNPQFIPENGPNGFGTDADGGMSTDALLDYLHKHGGPDGAKVVAYGTIDPHNVAAVKIAIALFGAVWVDILVQPGNQEEFDEGKPWTNTGEEPEGGHAVLGGGYVPQRMVATWADEAELSDSFWAGEAGGEPLVERVYVVIWPEHADKRFVNSTTAQMLADEYKDITGKDITWPVDPDPSPQPAPEPVPDPVPHDAYGLVVTDPQVVEHLSHTIGDNDPTEWANHHFRSYYKIKT